MYWWTVVVIQRTVPGISTSQVKRLARTAACPRGKDQKGFSFAKDGTTPFQLIHDYTEQ